MGEEFTLFFENKFWWLNLYPAGIRSLGGSYRVMFRMSFSGSWTQTLEREKFWARV